MMPVKLKLYIFSIRIEFALPPKFGPAGALATVYLNVSDWL